MIWNSLGRSRLRLGETETLRLDQLILAGLAEASEQDVYSTAARVWSVGRRYRRTYSMPTPRVSAKPINRR